MAAEHSADMLKHLEKQGEVLMEAYRSMSHELHRLQIEEEMLMQKLYKMMNMNGMLNKEKKRKYKDADALLEESNAKF
ncbi:uncharacterized protein LOC141848125 [Curcuma longa]|uniref:uncharacterized protein LOC141848125 n=1 Tax=Curcuma longa TaxID=136217 RepID=UPI003D9EB8B2